jgi:hypothetical protein
MDKEHENKINELVKNFIKEMNEWEIFCNKIFVIEEYTFDEKVEKIKDSCKKIFDEYCTQKDRKHGRPNIISYGSEGSYIYNEKKKKIIKTEQINKNKILVYTLGEDKDLDKFIYVILNKNKKWLLDSKKKFSLTENKWEIIYL